MPAGLVNQLLACHWMEAGVEMEEPDGESRKANDEILAAIQKIRKRKRPKFTF